MGATTAAVAGFVGVASHFGQRETKRQLWVLEREQSEVRARQESLKAVMEKFRDMKKDSVAMNTYFAKFADALTHTDEPATGINKMAEEYGDANDEVEWEVIQENVDEIIESLTTLENMCTLLKEQITKSQLSFGDSD